MVKTRHSLETKDESPSTFLTLQGLESRKLPKNAEDNDNSDDSSGVVHFSPRSLRHQSQKSDNGPSVRSRRGMRRQIIDEEDTDEADDSPVLQRSQRRRRGCSRTPKAEVEDCNNEVRRSSRQRKLLYGTFDPKILDRALYVDKQNYDDERPSKRRRQDSETININEEEDMYSRVKRQRKKIKRDMYGMPVPGSESENENEGDENEDEDTDDEENDDDTSDSDDEDEDEDNEEDDNEENDKDSDKPQRRSYYLREHKPRTKLFEVPIVERRPRRPTLFTETPESPVRISNKKRVQVYRSPAHRKLNLRRKAAFHGSSSTSSSSSSESSSDEERFQRRKAKSMAKARNQLLPMNLNSKDIANSGILKDRQRIGSSLADVDPMNIDRSIKFESVGGLEKHIRALKEMIVFPLMYPEVFERFKISPPRGVLFYGPPGTGKTLVARALANECSSEEKRVAFFMRKGADCLSKWVGESERQLRLLFDQAYQMRPAIIFFDEIDGLAPIRSSRQDQIHSSIVSTLLALMDGLDSRGEIVVIGATNRIDSIDPALRRPGRFDREFLFPLPSAEARRQILSIHTKDWNPQLSPLFIKEIAEKCVGYCGADIKALCTEAALFALRRRYPQIYTTSEKLQLDVSTINMNAKDFYHAMQNIVPASQRAVASPAKALAGTVLPLLRNTLTQTLSILQGVFPALISQFSATDTSAKSAHEKDEDFLDEFASDEEDDSVPSIYEPKDKRKKRQSHEEGARSFLSFSSNLHKSPSIHRPRLLLAGKVGQGQTTHLAPALLHHFEQLPVHVLDLPTLFAVSANSPEESCSQVFREAKRTSPSIIYMPHINQWWDVLGETFKATLLTLIQDLDPVAPVLILATSELPHAQLDYQLQFLFSSYAGEVHHMTNPTDEERKEFFSDLLLNQASRPPTSKRKAAMRLLEVLPKAPPPEPRKLTEKEQKILFDREEATLRELRIFLRDVLNQIFRDRKFHIFARPVDIEDVPDYYEIIKTPMDLSTMMSKIDLQHYQTGKEFQDDIDQICRNALEYNPDKDPAGRAIRHRACALRDTAHAIIKTELDPEFEKQCAEIVASRKRRGEAPGRTAPAFYHTKPLETGFDAKGRFSRRVRGLEVEQLAPLELVEKQWTLEKKSKPDTERSPKRSNETTPATKNCSVSLSKSKDLELRSQSQSAERCRSKTDSVRTPSSSSAHHSRPRKKEVWTYRRRRRKSKKRSFAELNSDINDVELFSLDDSDTEPQENTTSEQTLQVQIHSSPQESGALSPHNRPLHSPNRTLSPMQTSNSLSVEIPSDSKPCEEKSLSPSSNRTSCLHKSPDRSSSDKRMISPRSQEQPPNLSAIENCHTTDQGKDNCLPPKLVPAMETDSGISSSVDSNGDSVDSVEHAKQLAAEKLSELPSTSSSTNMNTENLEVEQHDTSPRFRVTRARVQTRDQEKALKLLEAPEQPLIVDQGQLEKLLSDVVISTKNFNIERLEKLYSMFSQCIFKHKNSYDKTSLIMELEQIHQRYITCTHV